MPKIIVIISAFIILLFGWQGSVLAVSAKIMTRDCKRLVSYQSSAEYKPGVYMRGRECTDSRVYMNCKPMTSNEQANLAAKCKKLLAGR